MNTTKSIVAVATAFTACAAGAQTWPQFENPMVHVMIAFDGTDLTAHAEGANLDMINYGDLHTAPADVLDGKFLSSQYGFLADGFITLPQDAAIWIEMTSASAGIEAYEGGMRMMSQNHTYAPMFGTAGSDAAWKWGGTMHHPWFAAANEGSYSMVLNLYIGDETSGAPLTGYGSESVTLSWQTIPAPSSAALLGLGGLLAVRRRR